MGFSKLKIAAILILPIHSYLLKHLTTIMLDFGRFFHNYFVGEAMHQFKQQYSEQRM